MQKVKIKVAKNCKKIKPVDAEVKVAKDSLSSHKNITNDLFAEEELKLYNMKEDNKVMFDNISKEIVDVDMKIANLNDEFKLLQKVMKKPEKVHVSSDHMNKTINCHQSIF